MPGLMKIGRPRISPLFFWPIFCLSGYLLSEGNGGPRISARDPLHVHCVCRNQWKNGRITNFAEVDVRRKTSFGSVIPDALVSVNTHELGFDRDTQSYRGDIGELEQWQRIPILVKTRDDQVIRGYVAAVYMVRVTGPAPWSPIPDTLQIPVTWEYSDGSMHTVSLVVMRGGEELRSVDIAGNSTCVNCKTLGTDFHRGDVFQIHIHPPWTSNFEFEGYTTKRSQAEFITTAVLSVRFTQD